MVPFVWHHCAAGTIEDLIETVQIDALHYFEDAIMMEGEFKAEYGDRAAALGCVDMDNLCRMDENPLRAYIRSILERCVPDGRFAWGSGDTIANCVPLENYSNLLDEARTWAV